MADKLCVFCHHFYFEMGSPGYSEYTPGWKAEIECTKYHWSMGNDEGTETFRSNIEKAESCTDYEQVEK